MTTGALPSLVAKEARALAPAWLACLAGIAASAVVSAWPFSELGIVAYLLGIAALGALSVGHEYGYGTLALLLSQPVRRERLLLVKLAVLAAMLVVMGAAASAVVLPRVRGSESIRLAFVLLPVVGLCVAPWLTITFRSAIAGAAFTLALPGTLLTVTQLVYLAAYRRAAPPDVETTVLWGGTIGFCAAGAVLGWRTFMRLEAIEGPGPSLGLPQWLRGPDTAAAAAPAFAKRNPIWLLVKKELHLQRMAFVVAGFYVLGWLGAVSLRPVFTHAGDVFDVLSVFYGLMIALLSGAVASAEERQLGTLEWQMLLPVASWKQWAVKVGVVLGLALLLGLGLPALLTATHPMLERFRWLQLGFGIVALATTSLYVSSACASGLWAMLMALPAVFGAVWFVSFLRIRMAMRLGRVFTVGLIRGDNALEPLMAAVFVAVLLWLALVNHRSADRDPRRFWAQGLWLTAGLTAATVAAVLLAR